MDVQDFPITDIVVEDRARKDMGDLESLAVSIKMKGIIQPITINQYKRLVAGERRLKAAQMAGLSIVPCIVRPTKGPVDKKEIELFENIHRKDMTWPEKNALVLEIHNLKADKDRKWTQERTAGLLGITQQEVSNSLELAEAIELMPDLKEAKDETSARKALSMLKENAVRQVLHQKLQAEISADAIANQETARVSRMYQVGDALVGLEECKPETFDFAEVDPPYGVKLEGHKNQGVQQKAAMADYREVTPKDYRRFLQRMCAAVYRVLKPDTYAIFWYGFNWHCALRKELEDAGFKVTAVPAIWLKSLTTGMASQPDITLSQCYEQFMVARKGEPKLGKPGRGNIFDFRPVPAGQKLHPTEKPRDLMRKILDTFLIAPGSRIVCPFLGSGVTILAAIENGHMAEGWDLGESFKQKFEERVFEWAEARKPLDVHLEQMARIEQEMQKGSGDDR